MSPVIPTERSDEGSLLTCHRFPPYPRLQIPRYARNDIGKEVPLQAQRREIFYKHATTRRRIASGRFPLVAGWPQQTLPPPMGVTGLIKPVTMAF